MNTEIQSSSCCMEIDARFRWFYHGRGACMSADSDHLKSIDEYFAGTQLWTISNTHDFYSCELGDLL